MGVNFYVIKPIEEPRKKLFKNLLEKEEYETLSVALNQAMESKRIHIAKSSLGWQMIFNHNDWKYYNSLESLKKFIDDNILIDEYEGSVSPEEFWRIFETNKRKLNEELYKENWHLIHPENSMPSYMNSLETNERYFFGLRFSSSTDFF